MALEGARSVLLNDLRYAARMMRRTPMFTAAVVLTVALAIAANTAIFTVVNAVLVRPLPFGDPDRLMQVSERNDRLNIPSFGVSALNFLSWRAETKSFEALAAVGFSTFTLSGGSGDPEQVPGNRISAALMPVLGLAPIAGRTFATDEEKPGGPAVAIIGEGVWRRRFGGDRSIVGQTVTINSLPTTIVGIAPAGLNAFSNGDVYVPLTIDPAKEIRLNHVLLVAGRLKRGVSKEQAQAEMDTVAAHVAQQYPDIMRGWGVRVVSFFDTFVSPQLKVGLLVLLAAVVFVLLIACANIANLLLARAAARQKEIAVRVAMGASRSRLLRQLMVESVALSALGGATGLAGAVAAVPLMRASIPPTVLPPGIVRIDAVVLTFAVSLTLAAGLLFGLAPAWHAAKADLNEMLKQTGRSAASGVRSRLRNGLAAAELALATVLLIGAGLLIQTLLNLERTRVGFESRGLMTFQLAPPTTKYPLTTKAPQFYRALIDSIQSVPGVRRAAVSSGIPFGAGNQTRTPMLTTGDSALPPETAVPIDWRVASPGYFRAMSIPLLRGRDFTDADGAPAPPVTIVSEATAKKFWGDRDPIGRTLHRNGDTARIITVVGVVGDVKNAALNQESPTLYYPMANGVWPLMDVVVRTDGAPASIMPAMRQKVRELDAGLALANVRTMEEWVATSAAQPRMNAALLGVFAGVALLIAALGIYGVLAYSVNQRTREIGLRLALGAEPGRVLRLVVGEGMKVGVIGIAAGLAGGAALGRVISSLVYGVPVRDPVTFATVGTTLTLVAFAACVIPARRAARVDPMIALRDE